MPMELAILILKLAISIVALTGAVVRLLVSIRGFARGREKGHRD